MGPLLIGDSPKHTHGESALWTYVSSPHCGKRVGLCIADSVGPLRIADNWRASLPLVCT